MAASNCRFVSADAALITDLTWQSHDVRHYSEAESDRDIGDGVVFDSLAHGRDPDREGVHLEDTKCISEGAPCESDTMSAGQWRVAGESGMPIVVTGKGETMQAARRQCYDRVDDIVIPNAYYRDDIGERWLDGDGDRLQAWGYLGSAR